MSATPTASVLLSVASDVLVATALRLLACVMASCLVSLAVATPVWWWQVALAVEAAHCLGLRSGDDATPEGVAGNAAVLVAALAVAAVRLAEVVR